MFYAMENSARVKKERQENKGRGVRKGSHQGAIAKEWKKLADKSKWEKMAAADKQRYQSESRS
jgi:hypothetical protein